MNPYRSGRAWIPAAVLSVVFAVTLVVLQLIHHFGYDDKFSPLSTDDSIVEWLFVNNLGFWGPGAFDPDETQVVIANLSAGASLIVVAFVVTWLALRGTTPGSSVLPAFFGGWFATMVAAPIASVVAVLVRSVDQADFPFGPAISGSTYATTYGLKWGWLAALVAVVVWMSVRPKPGIPGLGSAVAPSGSAVPVAAPSEPVTEPVAEPVTEPVSEPTTAPTTGTTSTSDSENDRPPS